MENDTSVWSTPGELILINPPVVSYFVFNGFTIEEAVLDILNQRLYIPDKEKIAKQISEHIEQKLGLRHIDTV